MIGKAVLSSGALITIAECVNGHILQYYKTYHNNETNIGASQ